MEITTRRLRLVPLTSAFFNSTCRYAMEREHIPMMVFYPMLSEEEVTDFLLAAEQEWRKPKPAAYEFAILRDGEHIGGLSAYFEFHPGAVELGWILRSDCRGFGYAAEAAAGVMRELHEKLNVNRFVAECDSENNASRAVIQKLGMTYLETHGGRRNRLSDEERQEELYELCMTPP